jgi:hypothetical protein
MMSVPNGLRVDNLGNIYVLDVDDGILKFASNATGNAAPVSDITASPSESFQRSIALQQYEASFFRRVSAGSRSQVQATSRVTQQRGHL